MEYKELVERLRIMQNWALKDREKRVYTAEDVEDTDVMADLEEEMEILAQVQSKFRETLTKDEIRLIVRHFGGLRGLFLSALKGRVRLLHSNIPFGILQILRLFLLVVQVPKFVYWAEDDAIAKLGAEAEEEE